MSTTFTHGGVTVVGPDGPAWLYDAHGHRLLGGPYRDLQAALAAADRAALPERAVIDVLVDDPEDTRSRIPAVHAEALLTDLGVVPQRNADPFAQLHEALRSMQPRRITVAKEATTTDSKSRGRPKDNGNVARVHKLCDELHKKHKNDLRRGHVIDAAVAEGISKGTASTQWQIWRKASGYDGPKAAPKVEGA